MIALALALALQQLPPSEEYTRPSFPRGLAKLLSPSESQALFTVRRFSDRDLTLWLIGGPADQCRGPPERLECPQQLFLQRGKEFRKAGTSRGWLLAVQPMEGLPLTLRFAAPESDGKRQQRLLTLHQGSYVAERVVPLVVDPLTQEQIDLTELDARAQADAAAGRSAAAAGRWAALCQLGCTAEQREEEGIAALRAELLPQAEVALREAVRLDPQRGAVWLLLGDLARAQGNLPEARADYQRSQRDPQHQREAEERLRQLAPAAGE